MQTEILNKANDIFTAHFTEMKKVIPTAENHKMYLKEAFKGGVFYHLNDLCYFVFNGNLWLLK